ncbi:MAG: RNB domain-containing ribonuclease [Bacilli bacterium]|nr:RNB domain-containing ribonuclease [Bacilli bacterium]
MSSNLNVLRDLLLTCPTSSKEEIFEKCHIDTNKKFAFQLIILYGNEIVPKEKKLNEEVTYNNLDDNQFFDYLINQFETYNKYKEEDETNFNNLELVDVLCTHLDSIIATHLATKDDIKPEVKEKTQEEIIEILKGNTNMNEIIKTLVFDIKDITFFKKILHDFPNVFEKHLKKEQNIHFLVEKYINLAKEENINVSDLIASSKIISYIVNNTSVNLPAKDRQKHIKTLGTTISKLSTSKYSDYHRKRIISALNILIEAIKNTMPPTKEKFEIRLNQKYGIKPEFSEQALKEMEHYKKVNDKLYVDLTSKFVITVDGNKTNCSEDAFSVEQLENGNYLLGIYITDVHSYIKDNSILELEAYNRAKTIYLPDQLLTMFPNDLVYNQFSLCENKKKYVMAHLFELSPKFDLVKHDIKRAIIEVDVNKSIKDIEKDVNKIKDQKISDMYQTLLYISNRIRKHNPFVKKHYSSKPKNNKSVGDSMNDIISNLMMYLNYNVDHDYRKLDMPCIYKIYSMGAPVTSAKDSGSKKLLISEHIINSLDEIPDRSHYSINNNTSSIKNLCVSMPMTVPVRNYAALQNQKLVQKYLIDKQPIKDKELYELEEQLDIISKHLNEKNKLINEYIEEYRYGFKKYKK